MTSEAGGSQARAVRWGLFVEELTVMYGRYEPRALSEFTGTRQEALARLEEHVREYLAYNPQDTARIRIYRTADGFYLMRDRGGMRTRGARFSVGELISDTDDAKKAAAAEKRAAKEAKAAERRARRERRRMPDGDDIEDGVEDDIGDGVEEDVEGGVHDV